MPFDNTRKALAAFDADRKRRDVILENAKTKAQIEDWKMIEEFALEDVRLAFLEDTKHVNNWSQAKVVTLDYMRKRAAKDS